MSRKSRPDPELTSPIPFYPGSNGEFMPRPPSRVEQLAEREFRRLVDDSARRRGVSRREMLTSTCGSAAALLVINQATAGCGGGKGGQYAVDAASAVDAGACEPLTGSEFIFDVQTHHVDLDRDWTSLNPLHFALSADSQGNCGEAERLACWSVEHYVREVFVKSDTTVACLTLFPGATPEARPLTDSEAAATRELVDQLAQSPRVVIHGMVSPELGQAQLDDMQRMAEASKIAAWKVYTQYGGWRLDDANVGIPFLERAKALGVRVVCAHKGLSFPDAVGPAVYSSPADFGPAAKAFPEIAFLAYHSGYETSFTEGPYDPNGQGVDRLIKSCEDAGIGPGGNVYAELGSTWRLLMTRPDEAAHVLGKLLKHLGEENVVWGTDSLWYGTPQAQIEAFRAFEISPALQQAHGYPALTPALKAKILGLNAATVYGVDPELERCKIGEDDLAARRAARAAEPELRLPPVGPATRREFLAFFRKHGHAHESAR